jgi:hypothetical protein
VYEDIAIMVADKYASSSSSSSHLFTLRLWPEDLGNGQIDWRGKVQHMNSGEAHYFRDWATLEAFVEGLLRAGNTVKPDAGAETGRQLRAA